MWPSRRDSCIAAVVRSDYRRPVPALKRQFVALLLCVVSVTVTARADQVIKIMAANLSSGNKQNYDNGEGNRIFRGLKPDIAMIQEMNIASNSSTDVRNWVNDNFGTSFSYFQESNKNIPNGIVSRYPILASGEWDDVTLTDREFVWAKIQIPGDKPLWAISVHLKASSGSSTQRNTQAGNLKAYIQANIPATDYIAIAGDFNTSSRTEACVTTFSSFMSTSGPYPVDNDGNANTNEGRNSPYDWVLPNPSLSGRAAPLTIGTHTFANGLVFDSRVYTPLSEVAPVLIGDSSATGMQHMGVMRAFNIPVTQVNAAPVIQGSSPFAVTCSRGGYPTPFALTLTASDANNDALSWSIGDAPLHGAAGVVASSGSANVIYHPAGGYTGDDVFTVQVSDDKGGVATAAVNVTVEPVSAYLAWAEDSFGDLSTQDETTVWGPGADPDGDGASNLMEFASGQNPAAADAGPNLLSCSLDDSVDPPHLLLTCLVRLDQETAAPALSYTLQASANPGASWSEVPLSAYTWTSDETLSPDFHRYTYRFNQPVASGYFYRLLLGEAEN